MWGAEAAFWGSKREKIDFLANFAFFGQKMVQKIAIFWLDPIFKKFNLEDGRVIWAENRAQ